MNISELLGSCKPGQALAQTFYNTQEIYARDMDMLLGRWVCVGHASELPKQGDYLLAELGVESAIIVHGQDGILRALANVCRHRGSRVCVSPRGHAAHLVCPYHAWSYHLDGRLRQARQMPEGFDPASHGLTRLPLEMIGGLIFISFAESPPSLDAARQALEPTTDRFGWTNAKVAARKTYSVAANWKLALENYHECYHCGPAHPEFSVLHALARPGNRSIGGADVEGWNAVPDGREVFRVMHSALAGNTETGSRDGRLLAPKMDRRKDGSECVFAEVGMLSAFLAYADYGVIYRFIPRAVLQTEMEVVWLVHGEAEAARDYDEAALTWLWDVTSVADKTIIERNQAGVLSRHYRPGPFSLMEPGARQYVERYVGEIAELVRAGT